jgi:hypothetical protein
VNSAYEAGVNAFIRKGLDVDVFFGKIKGLVNFWTHIADRPTLSLATGREESSAAAG